MLELKQYHIGIYKCTSTTERERESVCKMREKERLIIKNWGKERERIEWFWSSQYDSLVLY